jgi:hypothetical protein
MRRHGRQIFGLEARCSSRLKLTILEAGAQQPTRHEVMCASRTAARLWGTVAEVSTALMDGALELASVAPLIAFRCIEGSRFAGHAALP